MKYVKSITEYLRENSHTPIDLWPEPDFSYHHEAEFDLGMNQFKRDFDRTPPHDAFSGEPFDKVDAYEMMMFMKEKGFTDSRFISARLIETLDIDMDSKIQPFTSSDKENAIGAYYNAEQVAHIPELQLAPLPASLHMKFEDFLNNTKDIYNIRFNSDLDLTGDGCLKRNAFNLSDNTINLPPIGKFKNTESFVKFTCENLIAATSSTNRMERLVYSQNEEMLTRKIGGAQIASMFGFLPNREDLADMADLALNLSDHQIKRAGEQAGKACDYCKKTMEIFNIKQMKETTSISIFESIKNNAVFKRASELLNKIKGSPEIVQSSITVKPRPEKER